MKKVSLRELVADKIVFAVLLAVYYWMWARNDWRESYKTIQFVVFAFSFYYFVNRSIRLKKYKQEAVDEMAETNLKRCDSICLKIGAADRRSGRPTAISTSGTQTCATKAGASAAQVSRTRAS